MNSWHISDRTYSQLRQCFNRGVDCIIDQLQTKRKRRYGENEP
ncbi:MAG TPA: hypothetical protein V6C90_20980 [Coleofasciculaceae cyanobacterium]